jgi:hypothetical protein
MDPDDALAAQLRDHLASHHGAVVSADAPYSHLAEEHHHEHTGPGGIRNHPIGDLDADDVKAEIAYAEAAETDRSAAIDAEWEARAQRITTNLVAVAAEAGLSSTSVRPFNLQLSADPPDPDGDEPQRYYVDTDELTHGPGGLVTGVRRVRYELRLTRVGEVEPT